MPQILGAVREDVEHAPSREVGAVQGGLPFGNGLPFVMERLRPGPLTQLGPLHGSWLSPQRLPMGALLLPRVSPEVKPMHSAIIKMKDCLRSPRSSLRLHTYVKLR